MAESFNAWVLIPRNKIIISMLEEIRIKVMTRVSRARKFADSWIDDISPIAMMVFNANLEKSMCNINWNDNQEFEVTEGTYKHTVNLSMLPPNNLLLEREKKNSTINMDKTDGKYGNKRPRVVGQGIFVSKSGYTCINQGLASSRRVNTGIMSLAHVTGDIGYQPTKELKWKNLHAVTQRKLKVQTRSKAARIRTKAQLLGKSPITTKSTKAKLHQRKCKGQGKKFC
ncbi:hypothetical protein P3L10_023029 [Capsicum annuum]|uniref:uncharacterized protein LOC107879225 n=1 Tax=Capsicum annuum TaxID=4072 RepID=UPI001FB0A4D9|nr:uncharacterized protein LOC107879225 [Capsicum annuum]